MYFTISGVRWKLRYVPAFTEYLRRSDGTYTIGMTDGNTHEVFICNYLRGEKLRRVLCHELVHCLCFSKDIHIPILEEEWLANFVAENGTEIIYLLDDLLSIEKSRAM